MTAKFKIRWWDHYSAYICHVFVEPIYHHNLQDEACAGLKWAEVSDICPVYDGEIKKGNVFSINSYYINLDCLRNEPLHELKSSTLPTVQALLSTPLLGKTASPAVCRLKEAKTNYRKHSHTEEHLSCSHSAYCIAMLC